MECHLLGVPSPPLSHLLHRPYSLAGFRPSAKFAVRLLAFRPAPLAEIVGAESAVELFEVRIGLVGVFVGVLMEKGAGGVEGGEVRLVLFG